MNPPHPNDIRAYLGKRGGILFLALLPVAIWMADPSVVSNRQADIDTWFYFGHFLKLGQYVSVEANYANNYYQTRLPYIIPGYIIFHLFSLTWARLVFAYLIYATIIGSLFYTLRAHVAERAAILAATLLATDIFFVRTAGWNYVDNGVLAYQALAFAALTAAGNAEHRKAGLVAVAAFCSTSMVFVHIGSAILAPVIAGYAWLCLRPHRLGTREILALMASLLAGVAACQLIYGALNVWIWDAKFFFVFQQFSVGEKELRRMLPWQSPLQLFGYGNWLGVHLAVWIASTFALTLSALRVIRLKPFEMFCFLSVFALYVFLYFLDDEKLTYFLSRQGLYASFFLFFCYMTLGCLLARGRELSVTATFIIVSFLVASLVVRLRYSGADIPALPHLPTWVTGLAFALLLIMAYLVTNVTLKTALLCAVALPALFLQWKFEPTEDIYKTVMAVDEMAGKNLPRIWLDRNDPLFFRVLTSTVASFTERSWWLRGEDFPIAPQDALEGDNVFVINSRIHSLAQAQALLAPHVDRAIPIRDAHVALSSGDLWIGEFKVWNRIGLPARFSRAQLEHGGLPAATLPLDIGKKDGKVCIATQGYTPAGALTLGPAAGLAAGRYQIIIQYGPSMGTQGWDISARKAEGVRVIAHGILPSTRRTDARVAIPLTLTKRAQSVDVHPDFSGFGVLTVRSIAIRPLPDNP